ncbi:hypothetical protein [Dendronalium sp. ChiSLP03b]|uniref:hypothetical protein n=1 Tax=Dendronalium sp. ChiSLP03b TaxID=3075381 RepID=UPI002AD226C6|nr:hypothetical protein [Dendronalium sp. ChiSLP03b]MDZ8204634.1 hypothetical protein [Dendronalium sp. ChiSLP03b]
MFDINNLEYYNRALPTQLSTQIKQLTLEILKEESSKYIQLKEEEIKISENFKIWITQPVEELISFFTSNKKSTNTYNKFLKKSANENTDSIFKKFVKETGNLHFQIKFRGEAIAFARVHVGESENDSYLTELFVSDLARKIDESINHLRDQIGNFGFPVHLVIVPQLHTYTFCFKNLEQDALVYIIDSDKSYENAHPLYRNKLLSLDNFIYKIILLSEIAERKENQSSYRPKISLFGLLGKLAVLGAIINTFGIVMAFFGQTNLGLPTAAGGLGLNMAVYMTSMINKRSKDSNTEESLDQYFSGKLKEDKSAVYQKLLLHLMKTNTQFIDSDVERYTRMRSVQHDEVVQGRERKLDR